MGNYSYLTVEDLVRRCSVMGDVAAWEEFIRRFHRLIAVVVYRSALRMGDCSKQTVDDLVQETYLRFCADNYRILRNFEHRHPDGFAGFVKVVAANTARDHFKAAYSAKRGSNQVQGFADEFVPMAEEGSAGSPEAIERDVLMDEVRRHLQICLVGTDQERNSNIFWLYYRVGLSASAIAMLPGIGLTTKGVESLILRMTKELRERMAVPRPRAPVVDRKTVEGNLPAESF